VAPPATAIVFVHGLWLTGVESTLLRRRLATELQCSTHYFHYRSITAKPADILLQLREFLRALPERTVHLVGHSLGGVVVLRLLETSPDLRPGRAVLLGAPLCGSKAAQGLARWPIGAAMLGRAIEAEVLNHAPRSWDGRRDLGIIAGDNSVGLGKLVATLDEPNDGAICVAETQLPGVTDHIIVKTSHTGMLFSHEVVRQTASFLSSGKFAR